MKLTPWYVNSKCVLIIQCPRRELDFARKIHDDLYEIVGLFHAVLIADENMKLEFGEAI